MVNPTLEKDYKLLLEKDYSAKVLADPSWCKDGVVYDDVHKDDMVVVINPNSKRFGWSARLSSHNSGWANRDWYIQLRFDIDGRTSHYRRDSVRIVPNVLRG